jgi:hypothetical protein
MAIPIDPSVSVSGGWVGALVTATGCSAGESTLTVEGTGVAIGTSVLEDVFPPGPLLAAVSWLATLGRGLILPPPEVGVTRVDPTLTRLAGAARE